MIICNLYIGSRYPVKRGQLRATVKRVLSERGIDHAQVDISIVGSRKIKELNESKLGHFGVTDVLSFPQHDKGQINDLPLPKELAPHLGDIVISFPEAVKTARRFGRLVDDQINFYLEHGLFHLLGYHHDDH
ncbi:MAG: rRNA maturation RNase YbeY [Candidatus Pacebacteria bacterium]|nr:rRNA maturation RNase YbeY [Candidatus Paceibacterota bacterium]